MLALHAPGQKEMNRLLFSVGVVILWYNKTDSFTLFALAHIPSFITFLSFFQYLSLKSRLRVYDLLESPSF